MFVPMFPPVFLRRLLPSALCLKGLALSLALGLLGENVMSKAHAAWPEFPSVAPPAWVAQPLKLHPRLTAYDFAVSPDRQTVFVLARGLNDQQEDVMVMVTFDANGKAIRRKVLAKAEPDSNNRSELFFTTQGELVWDWNSRFFVWIDPKTLDVQAHPQCRVHAYPLEKTHRAQAKEEAQAWKLEQLKRLNTRFNLPPPPLSEDAWRSQPNSYKDAYRQLNEDTTAQVETLVNQRYLATMKAAADRKPPTSGLELDVGNGWPAQQYAKLEIEGQTWYCNIQAIAQHYPKTRWSKLAVQPDADKHRPTVDSKGRSTPLSIVTDGDMQLILHQRTRTSSYQEDLVGLTKTDHEMEWKIGPHSHRFVVKDRGLVLARSRIFRLANGYGLVQHKGQLYLLAKP